MSSKTAPPDVPSSPAPASNGGGVAKPKRLWTLAFRLALAYGLSAFLLLLATTAYSYWSLVRSFEREDVVFLSEETKELEGLIDSQPSDDRALRAHVERETAARVSSPLYIRVLRANGTLIAESPGMSDVLPSAAFPSPVETPRRAVAQRTLAGGRPAYAMSSTIDGDGRRLVVEIALDRTHEHRLLKEYRGRLLVVLMNGFMVCTLVGYVIARRGLRPLRRMAAVMERVGSSTLHERLDTSPYPAELWSLAATFNAMLRRLQDAFSRLSRFSADIAHELRTPIHNVRGMVEVTLGKDRTPDAESRRLLEPCLEECHRVSRLIDNLLFVARADNPQTQINRQQVDVRAELFKVQEFYEAAAAEAEIILEVSGQGTAGPNGSAIEAMLDRQLLQHAVCNLVENALAHTPRRGCITLSARRDGDAVRIEVADTGSGIPADHIPFVFDRFHRVDPSRSKNTGGMGLGLAIVKSIATVHGGSVAVESAVGQGSKFVLMLPVVAAARSEARTRASND